MLAARSPAEIPRSPRPTLLALGTFDGVHRGHQAVFRALVDRARAVDGRPMALTFHPHPLKVLAPPPEPFLLTTLDERLALFEAAGIEATLVLTFNDALRRMSAEAFVHHVLAGGLGVRETFSGPSFTFGNDRRGDVAMLERMGHELRFAVHVVPPVHEDGALISSTLIRRLLRDGRVEEAARYLGRPYSVTGTVVRGDRRGRELGFPTANLRVPEDKLLPLRGIYAGRARVDGETYEAAISLGYRPVFDGRTLVLEAHLLDASLDLYGREIALAFEARLHDEIRYPSVEALVAGIGDDVRRAREVLAPRDAGSAASG